LESASQKQDDVEFEVQKQEENDQEAKDTSKVEPNDDDGIS